MRLFLHRPIEKSFALLDKEDFQFASAVRLREQRFLLTADVEVHQRDRKSVESACAAQQMSIHQRLRPMQRAMIVGHALEIAAMRLDLFEPVAPPDRSRPRPPAHGQLAMCAGQRDFGFVAACAARPATVICPAMPSSEVGAGVKRRSRSPRRAVNSHMARTATT